MSSNGASPAGAYGPDSDIVDFILGITFEIWEQRGVDLIHRYYAPDVEVFSLEGLISGAQAMVDGTRATLEAFPDRLLVGDNVVWSGDRESGFYSSHRITSPMTNRGPSPFGPATGRRVHITNIADCVVENGVITREWLLRDNLSLVRQLGIDAAEAARGLGVRLDSGSRAWLEAEALRVQGTEAIAAQLDSTSPGLADRGIRLFRVKRQRRRSPTGMKRHSTLEDLPSICSPAYGTVGKQAVRRACTRPTPYYTGRRWSAIPDGTACLPITDISSGRSATRGCAWTTSPANRSPAVAGTSPCAGLWRASMPMPLPGRLPPASRYSFSAPATGALRRDASSPSGRSSTNWPCLPSC